jgi:hypothetical protein
MADSKYVQLSPIVANAITAGSPVQIFFVTVEKPARKPSKPRKPRKPPYVPTPPEIREKMDVLWTADYKDPKSEYWQARADLIEYFEARKAAA